MKFNSYLFCIILVFSSLYSTSFSQQIPDIKVEDLLKSSKEKTSYFKLQTSYLTNAVFNGRKDSAKLPYIMPSLEYNHKSGFYANATLSYLANKSSRVDVFDLTAGYNFDIGEKFSGNIYANKSFYNNSSSNIQSDILGSAGFWGSYATTIVNVSTSVNALFSSTTDLNISLGIDHPFYWGEESSLFSVTPSLTAYFGGSGFYQTYTEKRRNPRNNLPLNIKTEISSLKNFQLMSYELSLPFNYDAEKWGLFLSPTYAIPRNAVSTTYTTKGPLGNIIPGASGTFVEKLENVFYAEIGAYIKF